MLKEQLNEYLNRKELSKKAVDEIIAILVENNYSSKEQVEELAEVLFGLKPNAIYAFLCKYFEKIPDEYFVLFIETCLNAINSNKFTHAFGLSVALSNQSKMAEANKVISYLVQNYIPVKKANKQIYASFERAMHYDGAECFFAKWSGNDERIKNGYRTLLIEFLKEYPVPQYADCVTKWFNVNDIPIHSSEQEVIVVALKTLNNESGDEKEVAVSASAKKSKTVDLAQIPIAQLLAAVNNQALQLSNKINEIESEHKKLKGREVFLTDKLKSAELSLKTAEVTISSLQEKVKTEEHTINHLNRNLSVATEKITELNQVIEELNGKIENVESAYGHAGQQEIDFLKGEIKKRLASEYSKYIELKSKAPDLDYYDILLDMIDEIYHVLGKNGIKFD
ncbi:MAG: hypothetical protein K2K38_00210 [Clostridia bacterium]|nr:hypothetical protein [Clostridia bacterium]